MPLRDLNSCLKVSSDVNALANKHVNELRGGGELNRETDRLLGLLGSHLETSCRQTEEYRRALIELESR